MASNTENLGLLKKNPSTDGADTFNIQTMLNDNWDKLDANAGTVAQTLANILKPTTPPIIGLSPSTTPDGMFQALGNTGELHVWRKTVTTAQEIPAGYTLGKVVTGKFELGYYADTTLKTYTYASAPVVADDGTVTVSGSSISIGSSTNIDTLRNAMLGKFAFGSSAALSALQSVFYIPTDANITNTNGHFYLDRYQPVTGYAKVPAGTTITYPVSTNPNAYQEGSDAKPAGYTLGDVVSGLFRINRVYYSTTIQYADSVNVSDNGAVTLAGQSYYGLSAGEDSYNDAKKLAGKFIIADYDHNYCKIPKGVVLFIPANTTISFRQDVPGDEGYGIFFDRYQPVTGYAAIPAGTTIEYLGKLGDKAREQVVSYVGTGTYGRDHKNQLTFSGKPRFIMVPGPPFGYAYIPDGNFYYAMAGDYVTLEDLNCVWNDDTNTMTWYHSSYPYRQYNESGRKYTFVAMY